MRTDTDIWTYRSPPDESVRMTGYEVHASDGSIGTVDDASYAAGDGYIVVDTGPWIFGKRVMLPAGVVEAIDTGSGTVHVDATKQQVQGAPEYDVDEGAEDAYRRRLARYYAGTAPPGAA